MINIARIIRDSTYIGMSFFRIERAFKLASTRENDRAWALLNKRFFSALRSYPTLLLSIEYDLLKIYVSMVRGRVEVPVRIFTRIRQSPTMSYDEKDFLIRYVLGMLWHARGRNGRCIARIRDSIVVKPGLIRIELRRKFPDFDLL